MDARTTALWIGLVLAAPLATQAQDVFYPPLAPSPYIVVPHPYQPVPMMMYPQGGNVLPVAPVTMASGNRMTVATAPESASWPAPSLPATQQRPRTKAASPSGRRGQAVADSENFIVFANDPAWAKQVVETAEALRRDLAIHWLGRELPRWTDRCPIHVHDAEELGAGGETRFIVAQGHASSWTMSVQGTRERILDSVLPHEISHTIFASYFGKLNKYVPRWADEGAATTLEHEAEKSKHRHFLKQFLQNGRGLAFNKMFQLKEYPADILPLYAQGHSAVQFLIDQSSPTEFVKFLELGMQTENWPAALNKFYAYESIWDFQDKWNKWLLAGSPQDLLAFSPRLAQQQSASIKLASNATAANPPVHNDAGSPDASWFQTKLLQTSGYPANPIPQHNHFPAVSATTTRPISSGNQPLNQSGASTLSTPPVAMPAATVLSGSVPPVGMVELRPAGYSGSGHDKHVPAGGQSSAGGSSTVISTARPQAAQSTTVQVLDWGDSRRFSGLPQDGRTLR